MRIDIKPLTVNQCWQGRRFKTDSYKTYEKAVYLSLPQTLAIPGGDLGLIIEAGFSSKGSDIDNIAKPFIDILQKKYKFNDNRIYELTLNKRIVNKGDEYIWFKFYSIKNEYFNIYNEKGHLIFRCLMKDIFDSYKLNL